MARFLGLEIQTDILVASPAGAAPAVVARFRPAELLECTALLSPIEPEALTVRIARDDPRVAELVMGRVLRVVTEGGVDDSEWDIATVEDASLDPVISVTATPILTRLARVIYMGAAETTGMPRPNFSGVEKTATEWMTELVLPALAAAGLPFGLGTVDATQRFALSGEWASILEVVNAIAAPGRANAEVRLRAGGSYGYLIDLVDAIGSSANVVRVRTRHNLLSVQRTRSMLEVANRLFARGSTESVATRTMSEHLWRVASVSSGMVGDQLVLEDPAGGAPPIAYEDQLRGLFCAVLNAPTFEALEVDSATVAGQQIEVIGTFAVTPVVGDLVRFQESADADGPRLTSLAHPTLIAAPADGGYGDRAQVLDRADAIADTNLVANGTLADWPVAADPATGWDEFAEVPADVTFSQVTGDSPEGTTFRARRVEVAADVMGPYTGDTMQPAVAIEAPVAQPWNDSFRRYVATQWIKVLAAAPGGKLVAYLFDRDRANAEDFQHDEQAGVIGSWVDGVDEVGTWIRLTSAPLAFDGVAAVPPFPPVLNGPVRGRVELQRNEPVDVAQPTGVWRGRWDAGTSYNSSDWVEFGGLAYQANTSTTGADPSLGGPWDSPVSVTRTAAAGWDVLVSAVTLAEASEAIGDREGSGGTVLWQEANAALATTASPVKGYDLEVADLAADDPTTFAALAFTPGGMVEVTDPTLNLVSTLRLVQYQRDYLRPQHSKIRVGRATDTFTRLAEAGLVTSAARVA